MCKVGAHDEARLNVRGVDKIFAVFVDFTTSAGKSLAFFDQLVDHVGNGDDLSVLRAFDDSLNVVASHADATEDTLSMILLP